MHKTPLLSPLGERFVNVRSRHILESWLDMTEARMLLPFSIWHNGHLLRDDGYLHEGIGNDRLYYLGLCNPAMPYQGTPLALILANWWELVVDENWLVNIHGVTGNELHWATADTETFADHFQLNFYCGPPIDRSSWRRIFYEDVASHDEL